MPITASQSDHLSAYYTARKDYNKLLFDALADAPPGQSRVHPLEKDKAKSEKEPAKAKNPEQKRSEGSKPGEFLQELVDMLEEHRISGPNVGRFAGLGKGKAEGKGQK